MRSTAIALAGLSLAGCGSERADICSAVPSADMRLHASAMAADEAQPMNVRHAGARMVADFCLSQNSRQLARASDRAETVARAVVEKCRAEIEAFAGLGAETPPVLAALPLFRDRFTEQALALTVEARAGGCKPIP